MTEQHEWAEWDDLPLILTVSQVAEVLQVHETTVKRWLRDGRLPGLKLGDRGDWRIRREALRRFLQDREGGGEAA